MSRQCIGGERSSRDSPDTRKLGIGAVFRREILRESHHLTGHRKKLTLERFLRQTCCRRGQRKRSANDELVLTIDRENNFHDHRRCL
jgi:hypothetical protein